MIRLLIGGPRDGDLIEILPQTKRFYVCEEVPYRLELSLDKPADVVTTEYNNLRIINLEVPMDLNQHFMYHSSLTQADAVERLITLYRLGAAVSDETKH